MENGFSNSKTLQNYLNIVFNDKITPQNFQGKVVVRDAGQEQKVLVWSLLLKVLVLVRKYLIQSWS